MPTTPAVERPELARFRTLSGPTAQRVDVAVHFNPESLQYTVQNTIKEEGKGQKKKQHVSQTTAKLSMQLVFDTTQTGADVRTDTDKMARLLQPFGGSGSNDKTPPLVEFRWGTYRFNGIVEQYKETIDFFSAGGVPLRALIDITLGSQDVVFQSSHNPNAKVDGTSLTPATVHAQPAEDQTRGPAGASALANALGDPRAARAIASLNGSGSLRFGAGVALAVGGSVSLQAAAAFSVGVSASAGIGIGTGAGIGGGAGVGIGIDSGASAGAGISASTGASFGAGGSSGVMASTSADVSASGGAFAALRTPATSLSSVQSGVSLFAPQPNVDTRTTARFAAGGRAQIAGGASLSANVGAEADLTTRISFG